MISAAAPITPCLELNGGRSVSAGRTPRDSRAAVVASVYPGSHGPHYVLKKLGPDLTSFFHESRDL